MAQLTRAWNVSTLARLETQLDSLDAVLQGASPEAIERRPAQGKWSARENIAHLARCHQVFLERLDSILQTDSPRLSRYRAEEDSEWPAWQSLHIAELMQRLKVLRAGLLARARTLTEDQLSRTGVHSRFGAMPLSFWFEFFLVHEAHHIYVILQLARRLETASP